MRYIDTNEAHRKQIVKDLALLRFVESEEYGYSVIEYDNFTGIL